MCINNPWKHLRPSLNKVKQEDFNLTLIKDGRSISSDLRSLKDGLLRFKNERFKTLDNYLERYLVTVQKWDVKKIKLYLKNTKNVKVKGIELLQRTNRQGSSLEYWYYGQDCIMVTNKYTLEIVEVGDWIK